jgi:hypothetical protein
MRPWFAIALTHLLLLACSSVHSYEVLQQATGTTLRASVGGKIFRIERSSDLPNAYGKADVFGGKVDRGFLELRFVGVSDDGRLVLRITDIETRSNETTMSRYGAGYAYESARTTYTPSGSWTTASGVYIPPPSGQTQILPPNTVEFLYGFKSGSLLIEGIEVTFEAVTPQAITYKLLDRRQARD